MPQDSLRHAELRLPDTRQLRYALLTLQLHFLLEVSAARFSLVSSAPEAPSDDMGGVDAPLRELDRDAADFLDRPAADQERRLLGRRGSVFLSGGALA